MYNERLEQLIDAALADGELTEKEKQILFKKAQEMGVDLDEFEMVLDARLVKLKKAEENNKITSAPKSNKVSDVKKCPNCGTIVQSYQGVCSECGYAFEGLEANSSAEKLSVLLDKVMIENNSLQQKEGMSAIDLAREKKQRIVNAIQNFPIPNTKADLFEFITSLQMKISGKYGNEYNKKLKECILKAKLLYPNDKLFVDLVSKVEDEQKKRSIKRKKIFLIGIPILIGIIIGGIIAINYLQKQRDLKEDPYVLYTEVKSLLEDNEIDYAEKLVKDFADYNTYINDRAYSACNDILITYISNNQIEKAIKLYNYVTSKSFDYSSDVWNFLSALRLYYVENKQYDEGRKYILDNDNGYYYKRYVTECIIAMINSGEEEKAKAFFNKNKKRFDLNNYSDKEDYEKISLLLSEE